MKSAFDMRDDGNHSINNDIFIPPKPSDDYSKTEILNVEDIIKAVNQEEDNENKDFDEKGEDIMKDNDMKEFEVDDDYSKTEMLDVSDIMDSLNNNQVDEDYSKTEMLDVNKIMEEERKLNNAAPEPPKDDSYTLNSSLNENENIDDLTGVKYHEDSNGLTMKENPVMVDGTIKTIKNNKLMKFVVIGGCLGVAFFIVIAVLLNKFVINKNKLTYYFYNVGNVMVSDTLNESFKNYCRYTCKSNNKNKCFVDNYSSNEKEPYAVIYDSGYYVFNYNTEEKIELADLKKVGYTIKDGKTSLFAYDANNNLKGFVLTTYNDRNKVVTYYYSISQKKITFSSDNNVTSKDEEWIPYVDSTIAYFIDNRYIALYNIGENGVVNSKLVDFKSGDPKAFLSGGYYSAYYDSIRKNWYIVAKEENTSKSKIKLLNDNLTTFAIENMDFMYVIYNSNDKNIAYLTDESETYYVCDVNGGTCDSYSNKYKIYAVVDNIYKIARNGSKYAILKANANPIDFRDYVEDDTVRIDYSKTNYYSSSLKEKAGLYIYFANDDNTKCEEYYLDDATNTVTKTSTICEN